MNRIGFIVSSALVALALLSSTLFVVDQRQFGVVYSLGQIKEGAETTLTRIREVASATKEQSVASTSIAQRVEQISQMVEETSAAMSSTAETAAQMEAISVELARLIQRFRC